MKYFSELLNKTFDTELECKIAENEFLIAERNNRQIENDAPIKSEDDFIKEYVDAVADIDKKIEDAKKRWSDKFDESYKKIEEAEAEVSKLCEELDKLIDEYDERCAKITQDATDEYCDIASDADAELSELEKERDGLIDECVNKYGHYEDDKREIRKTKIGKDCGVPTLDFLSDFVDRYFF